VSLPSRFFFFTGSLTTIVRTLLKGLALIPQPLLPNWERDLG
jgi:hypothetical protein